jgi:hypothetical protein
MHPSKIVFLINDDVTAFTGVYDPQATNEKPRMFKTMIPDLAVGDMVVVQSEARHGFSVVSVKELNVEPDIESSEEIRWAFHKIEQAAIKELTDMEAAAITQVQIAERKRRKEKLREAMFGGQEDVLENLKLVNHTDG